MCYISVSICTFDFRRRLRRRLVLFSPQNPGIIHENYFYNKPIYQFFCIYASIIISVKTFCPSLDLAANFQADRYIQLTK